MRTQTWVFEKETCSNCKDLGARRDDFLAGFKSPKQHKNFSINQTTFEENLKMLEIRETQGDVNTLSQLLLFYIGRWSPIHSPLMFPVAKNNLKKKKKNSWNWDWQAKINVLYLMCVSVVADQWPWERLILLFHVPPSSSFQPLPRRDFVVHETTCKWLGEVTRGNTNWQVCDQWENQQGLEKWNGLKNPALWEEINLTL